MLEFIDKKKDSGYRLREDFVSFQVDERCDGSFEVRVMRIYSKFKGVIEEVCLFFGDIFELG